MGYYTSHTFKVTGHDEVPQEIQDYIEREQDKNDSFAYGIAPNGDYTDEAKWYDHKEDMMVISKQFPEIEFVLHGEGEEQGDVWDETYLGGKLAKTRRAKIVMEEV